MSCSVGAFNAAYHTKIGVYHHEMGIKKGGKLVIMAGAEALFPPAEVKEKDGIDLHFVNTGKMENSAAELREMTGGTGFDAVFCYAPVAVVREREREGAVTVRKPCLLLERTGFLLGLKSDIRLIRRYGGSICILPLAKLNSTLSLLSLALRCFLLPRKRLRISFRSALHSSSESVPISRTFCVSLSLSSVTPFSLRRIARVRVPTSLSSSRLA